MKTTTEEALPVGVLKSDLVRPTRFRDWAGDFQLWLTTFGWVVPTLAISTSRRGGFPPRTYAVKVSDGGVCRVGAGPHVKKIVTVYVRKSRRKVLQRFLDLREKGKAEAGEVRDRISSRRAEGALRRSRGERSWYWTV